MSPRNKGSDPEASAEIENVADDAVSADAPPEDASGEPETGADQANSTPEEDSVLAQSGQDEIEDAEILGESDAAEEVVESALAEDADLIADSDETAADPEQPVPDDGVQVDAPEPEEITPVPAIEAQPVAEPAYVAPPPAPAPAEKSRGGFIPAVIGGLVAAGLGYGVAIFTGTNTEDQAAIDTALSQQATQLADLDKRIAEIATAVATPDTSAVEGQLTTLTQQLSTQFGDMSTRFDGVAGKIGDVETQLKGFGTQLGDVDTRLGAVNDRLTSVEKRPLVESSETAKAAFETYERELDQLQASLDEQKTLNTKAAAALEETAKSAQSEMAQVEQRASTLQSKAEATARAAAVREALARLTASLEQGTPYASTLAILADGNDVPEVLTANADSGVSTISSLRASFPAEARRALDASIKAQVGTQDPVSRIGSFLRSQTGVRSLAPREGDDADAVLSRAEAAISSADLQTALTEIGTLPQSGQDALATWVGQAQTRLAVTSAATDLTKTLLAN